MQLINQPNFLSKAPWDQFCTICIEKGLYRVGLNPLVRQGFCYFIPNASIFIYCYYEEDFLHIHGIIPIGLLNAFKKEVENQDVEHFSFNIPTNNSPQNNNPSYKHPHLTEKMLNNFIMESGSKYTPRNGQRFTQEEIYELCLLEVSEKAPEKVYIDNLYILTPEALVIFIELANQFNLGNSISSDLSSIKSSLPELLPRKTSILSTDNLSALVALRSLNASTVTTAILEKYTTKAINEIQKEYSNNPTKLSQEASFIKARYDELIESAMANTLKESSYFKAGIQEEFKELIKL